MKILMLLISGIISTALVKGQHKRLHIGDKVPDVSFENIKNYPGGKAKLSDFFGKFLILDFWTRGCTVCIAKIPSLEKLQEKFKDQIQVLLITKNNSHELDPLFRSVKNLKNTKLPIIIGDSILATQVFPHDSVPFFVWLDPNGYVKATTYSVETNEKNILNLIENKPLDILIKNENLDKSVLDQLADESISLL